MSRLVKLDKLLLALAVGQERDPVTAEFACRDAFAVQALSGPAYALIDGGELVGAGGLVPHWPGRAEGWWLTGKCARPRQLVKAVHLAREFLNARQRDPAFRRIEMFVRGEERWALTFAEALGFSLEGVLKAWDPMGRDMLLCARVAA